LNGFGPEQMKIALGGIETFFGVFLGAISDTLFGKEESAAKDAPPPPIKRGRRQIEKSPTV